MADLISQLLLSVPGAGVGQLLGIMLDATEKAAGVMSIVSRSRISSVVAR